MVVDAEAQTAEAVEVHLPTAATTEWDDGMRSKSASSADLAAGSAECGSGARIETWQAGAPSLRAISIFVDFPDICGRQGQDRSTLVQ